MQIGFITHYSSLYGANRSLLGLIEGLTALGARCFVVMPQPGDLAVKLEALGVPYAVIPVEPWMQTVPKEKNVITRIRQYQYVKRQALKRFYTNVVLFPELVAQLRRWNVDLVYSNSSVISVGLLAAKYLHKPHVLHVREFGYEDYGMKFDWGSRLSNAITKASDTKIVISKALLAHHFAQNDPSVHVIYNGILSAAAFDRLRAEKTRKPRTDHFTFAIVGLIHPGKGQDSAVKALAVVHKKYPGTRLVIAGGGNREFLDQTINQLQMHDAVEFPGFIADPFRIYSQVDCLLVCSKFEGMGRVTVEAMAAGCPVIGYDSAGTAEIIEHEKTGLLYKTDHTELAACMIRVMEDAALAARLAEKAWSDAREKYTTEIYASKVHAVIRELCK